MMLAGIAETLSRIIPDVLATARVVHLENPDRFSGFLRSTTQSRIWNQVGKRIATWQARMDTYLTEDHTPPRGEYNQGACDDRWYYDQGPAPGERDDKPAGGEGRPFGRGYNATWGTSAPPDKMQGQGSHAGYQQANVRDHQEP